VTEVWLPVLGHEGAYEVSDQGRVRSLDRWVDYRDGRRRWFAGKVLATGRLPEMGYLTVHLSGHTLTVHTIVAKAFIGASPFEGAQVRHLDGVATNNTPANLAWGTPAQNGADKRRHRNSYQLARTHCPLGHVLEEPNLIVALVRRGKRGCLACDRGRGALRKAAKKGLCKSLQVEADRAFEKIMGSS